MEKRNKQDRGGGLDLKGDCWWDGAYRKEDASEHGTHLLAHGVEREGLLLRVVAIDQRLELEPVLVYIYIHIYIKGRRGESDNEQGKERSGQGVCCGGVNSPASLLAGGRMYALVKEPGEEGAEARRRDGLGRRQLVLYRSVGVCVCVSGGGRGGGVVWGL